MSVQFAPYHDWLGLPAGKRPQNHYDWLGLPLFEKDPRKISRAGQRQYAAVRKYQSGKHGPKSLEFLTEIGHAVAILADPERKREYDESLRGSMLRDIADKAKEPVVRDAGKSAPQTEKPTGLMPSVGKLLGKVLSGGTPPQHTPASAVESGQAGTTGQPSPSVPRTMAQAAVQAAASGAGLKGIASASVSAAAGTQAKPIHSFAPLLGMLSAMMGKQSSKPDVGWMSSAAVKAAKSPPPTPAHVGWMAPAAAKAAQASQVQQQIRPIAQASSGWMTSAAVKAAQSAQQAPAAPAAPTSPGVGWMSPTAAQAAQQSAQQQRAAASAGAHRSMAQASSGWMSGAAIKAVQSQQQQAPEVGWMGTAAVAAAKVTQGFSQLNDILRDAADATRKEADARKKLADKIADHRDKKSEQRSRWETPQSKMAQAARERLSKTFSPLTGLLGRAKDTISATRNNLISKVVERTGIPQKLRDINKAWDVGAAMKQRREAQVARAARQGKPLADVVRSAGRVFDFKGATGPGAAAKSVLGRAGASAGTAAKGARVAGGAATAGRTLGAVAGGARMAGLAASAGGALAGGLGVAAVATAGLTAAVAGVVGLGAAAVGVSFGLNKMGRSLAQSVEHLKQYNGSIAMSLSQLKLGDIRRDIKSGKATQMSVGANARATDRLADNLRPLEDFGTNLSNYASSALQNGISSVFEAFGVSDFFEEMIKKTDEMAKKLGVAETNQMTPYKQFLGDLAQGKFGERKVPRVKSQS